MSTPSLSRIAAVTMPFPTVLRCVHRSNHCYLLRDHRKRTPALIQPSQPSPSASLSGSVEFGDLMINFSFIQIG